MKTFLLKMLSIGAITLIMSGCAASSISDPSKQNLSLADLMGREKMKSSENLEPWNVKRSGDTHYMLDVFYVLPNAKTQEQADERLSILLDLIIPRMVIDVALDDKKMKERTVNYGFVKLAINKEGLKKIFVHYSYDVINPQYAQGAVKAGGVTDYAKRSYIGFKTVLINGSYYIVVEDTNARNIGIFSGMKENMVDVIDAKKTYDPVTNRTITHLSQAIKNTDKNKELSSLISNAAKEQIRARGLSGEFIDVQTDSNDDKATMFREKFVQYFRGQR